MDYRYIIGIDLGTTNSALSYIDTKVSKQKINTMQIPQITSLGEVNNDDLLPSFFYNPDNRIIVDSVFSLPWNKDNNEVIGIFARDKGVEYPERFVSSVKSWLCHSGIDRKNKVLPWGKQSGEKYSPLELTSKYLKYLSDCWNYKFSNKKDENGEKCYFEKQLVVVTIPASFDETARELTLEAISSLGVKNVYLLEEPLAVFYSWLSKNEDTWSEHLEAGESVLIIDVGGGTTDFSIISLNENGVLSRVASGEHLLLGGDNIDLAIAKQIESNWKTKLSHSEWLQLTQSSRQAKERLLNNNIDETEVTLMSKGSSIIASTRKEIIKLNYVKELILSGFIPEVDLNDDLRTISGGIKTMGLPYVKEPAITKHLLKFLKYANRIINSDDSTPFIANKVLFNGGTLAPEFVRKRFLKVLNDWSKTEKIEELDVVDLRLSVSQGATYYGATKLGVGVKVKCATNSSYYLKLNKDGKDAYVCVLPRGIDDGVTIESLDEVNLITNSKVIFPVYASATRVEDQVGDIVIESDELSLLSNLLSTVKFGKGEQKDVKCKIISQLTETGVLKIYLQSLETDHIWPLTFDTRLVRDEIDQEIELIERSKIDMALETIKDCFSSKTDSAKSLFKNIEKIIELPRKKWPLYFLRELVDSLLEIDLKTIRIDSTKQIWLNLCGFSMRPGFGDPADEIRIKKIWKIWYEHLSLADNNTLAASWWVFWRRISSGMRAGHQRTISEEILKRVLPKKKYAQKVKQGEQAKTEMWRCLGALELLTQDRKISILKPLLQRVDKLTDYEFWAIARLCARQLFNANSDYILTLDYTEKVIERILKSKKSSSQMSLFALSRAASRTGDRALDMSEEIIVEVEAFLKINNAPESYIKHLNEAIEYTSEENAKLFGESLPLGISL